MDESYLYDLLLYQYDTDLLRVDQLRLLPVPILQRIAVLPRPVLLLFPFDPLGRRWWAAL